MKGNLFRRFLWALARTVCHNLNTVDECGDNPWKIGFMRHWPGR